MPRRVDLAALPADFDTDFSIVLRRALAQTETHPE